MRAHGSLRLGVCLPWDQPEIFDVHVHEEAQRFNAEPRALEDPILPVARGQQADGIEFGV